MKLFKLPYKKPYRYDLIIGFLEFRAIKGVEIVRDGMYARTCAFGDDVGWICVSDNPAESCIQLEVGESLHRHAETLQAKVARLFDVAVDPADVNAALSDFFEQTDERYRIEGIRLPCSMSGLEMSIRAVIGQQITVRAANTIAGRLADEFGAPCETPLEGLNAVFPDAEAFAADFAAERMGRIGIIGQRARAIQAISRGVLDGSIVLELDADAAQTMAALEAIKGIGPWTSNYIAMRALGYRDAFPAADYGVKVAFPGFKPAEIEHMSQAWRPYRSYATMCTWCAH